MKKFITLLMIMSSLTFFSTSILALEAEGVIQELKQCRTGGPWKILLFKVDGNWFSVTSEYYNHPNNGISDFVGSSMVMQAFAAGYTVKVKGTSNWDATHGACGDAVGHVIHTNAGDYIQLIK